MKWVAVISTRISQVIIRRQQILHLMNNSQMRISTAKIMALSTIGAKDDLNHCALSG